MTFLVYLSTEKETYDCWKTGLLVAKRSPLLRLFFVGDVLMNNDLAVASVLEYVETMLDLPEIKWKKELIQTISYGRWAAHEIITRLEDRPFDQPCMIIDDFIVELDSFLYSDHEEIFEIAMDTAENIRDLYIYISKGDI